MLHRDVSLPHPFLNNILKSDIGIHGNICISDGLSEMFLTVVLLDVHIKLVVSILVFQTQPSHIGCVVLKIPPPDIQTQFITFRDMKEHVRFTASKSLNGTGKVSKKQENDNHFIIKILAKLIRNSQETLSHHKRNLITKVSIKLYLKRYYILLNIINIKIMTSNSTHPILNSPGPTTHVDKQILTSFKYNINNPTARKGTSQFRESNVLENRFDSESYTKRLMEASTAQKKDRIVEDLQTKLELSQRQNAHLTAENNSLSQLLAEKNKEIQVLASKFQIQLRGLNSHLADLDHEKNRLVEQLELKHLEHRTEVDKLLEEISKMHDQCYTIESSKNFELQKLKETLEKQTYTQMQNLKRSHNANTQLYETQIRKLKETVELKNFEMETNTHHFKLSNDKLGDQIKHLTAEIKHLNQIREIQLEQCKDHYENQVYNKIREFTRAKEIDSNNVEAAIRKLKKELSDKSIEVEKMTNTLGRNNAQNESQLQILKDDKQKLRLQIAYLEDSHRQNLRREKERIESLSNAQIQNLQNANINYANSLKSEIEKLYDVTECKTTEIKNLYAQIDLLKEQHAKEIEYYVNLNKEITQRLENSQLAYHEELELLKIKMAQLHDGDVKSLKDYYENQLLVLSEQVKAQEKILDENREKIHNEIRHKNEIRKLSQIEISKEKAKCADLKVKLAAATLQMKQQLVNMSSKIELTSMTYIRENQQKEKGSAIHEEEKRKLFHLIKVKDKEIADAAKNLEFLKNEYALEKQSLLKQLETLKGQFVVLDEASKKKQNFYQQQLRRKQAKSEKQIQALKAEIKETKQSVYAQVKATVNTLQKENLRLQKALETSEREKLSYMQQLGLKEGFLESMQLESCAVIEEEKNKVKVLMNKNEISMKNYFEDKVKSKEAEILNLKQQIAEKDQDLRDVIIKYNGLEDRMSLLLASQDKLRDFENKVMNLGMDNNLIKNLAELFKNKK